MLPLFTAERPDDDGPARAIAQARAYAAGGLDTATEIRTRFDRAAATGRLRSPAAAAAAKAAGQSAVVSHMGAHALGAAGYAITAATLADPDAFAREVDWQLDRATPAMRKALALLPRIGQDRAGPLGPGLLSRGTTGRAIAALQDRLC